MLVRHLGLRLYSEVMGKQFTLLRRRVLGEAPDTLLLAQHPPVYTRGAASRQQPPHKLPFPLHTVDREGGLFYHGPGQLAGYPVFDLRERGLTLAGYRRSLEGVLMEALLGLGVKAARRKGAPGLWARGRRLVFIGVAARRGISCHGFALNVNCDLAPFQHITPRSGPGWTSLAELLGKPQDETAAAKAVAEAFLRYF
ncbi:MAG: lipoyl(octanoyl) transferase LipB [Elusimicrobia bacterium]|nr:lipoyl(octanoyl) transferase LipB [Elusimicrobiota bacterium]